MPAAIPLIAAFAGIAGGVAVGAGTIVGGLMIAGGAMTAIGAVTKNQTLTKLGGLVGLAGGVTGLATGAWSAAADSAASEAAATDSVAQPLSQSAADSGMSLEQSTSAAQGLSETAGAVGATDAGSSAAMGYPVGAPLAQTAGVTDTGSAASMGYPVGSPMQPLLGTSSTTPVPDPMATYASDGQDATQASQFGSAPTNPAVRPQGLVNNASTRAPAGSMTTGVGQWVKDNKELVNLGAGLVGGGMQALSQQELAKTQAELADEMLRKRQGRYSDSVRNLQAPVYVPPKG